jgi:putative transposase
MRRAHGRFGLRYNKRHDRLGKVAHDRPKTIRIQDERAESRVMLYLDCNPVRAGVVKKPTDIRLKNTSSCRYYAYGESSKFSDMLTPPEWYLKLGATPAQRQHKYRALLDKYLIENGLKRDPTISTGYFLGESQWVDEMRELLKTKTQKTTGSPSAREPTKRIVQNHIHGMAK